MKKMYVILLIVILLSGCAPAETFETISDVDMSAVIGSAQTLQVRVEEDAYSMQGETGTIYLCDGYTVTVEVLPGGNLNGTLQALTGFGLDELTVIETAAMGIVRYECVWSAAGECGDVVGRIVIMDDGRYHYCVSVNADAEDAGALQAQWEEILSTIRIV